MPRTWECCWRRRRRRYRFSFSLLESDIYDFSYRSGIYNLTGRTRNGFIYDSRAKRAWIIHRRRFFFFIFTFYTARLCFRVLWILWNSTTRIVLSVDVFESRFTSATSSACSKYLYRCVYSRSIRTGLSHPRLCARLSLIPRFFNQPLVQDNSSFYFITDSWWIWSRRALTLIFRPLSPRERF